MSSSTPPTRSETSPKLILADLGGIGASEIVAGFAPGARIVKAFNSIRMAHFNEGPIKGQGKRVIFVSGDDEEFEARHERPDR